MVFCATHGPVENHAQRGIRVGHSKGYRSAAPHAAAHEVRPLDAQMIQQPLALCREMRPCHTLNAAARLTALAAVEDDAGVPFGQVAQQPGAGVSAKGGPLLKSRVEAAGSEHQHGRARANHLVTCRDAVDFRGRHLRSDQFTRSPV